MSLSQRFSGRKGKNGECEAIIQGGGFVSVALPNATTTTQLNTVANGSTASHLLLTTSSSVLANATAILSSSGVERGALKKVGLAPGYTASTVALASQTSGPNGICQIVNGTTLVTSITYTYSASTGAASLLLQYIGNNTWKLVEINGTVTIV